MIVYRVGHSQHMNDGTGLHKGPYGYLPPECDPDGRSDEVQSLMSKSHRNSGSHPVPQQDEGFFHLHDEDCDPSCGNRFDRCDSVFSDDESCGTDSLESLKSWFGEFLPMLLKVGWTVRRYEVPDGSCKVSSVTGQVLFRHDDAVLLDD